MEKNTEKMKHNNKKNFILPLQKCEYTTASLS
jgi:hypothetical protein